MKKSIQLNTENFKIYFVKIIVCFCFDLARGHRPHFGTGGLHIISTQLFFKAINQYGEGIERK